MLHTALLYNWQNKIYTVKEKYDPLKASQKQRRKQ